MNTRYFGYEEVQQQRALKRKTFGPHDKHGGDEADNTTTHLRKRARAPAARICARTGPAAGLNHRASPNHKLKPNHFEANADILSHVASFLDLRSLHKFAIASKTCQQGLGYQHVAAAALYQGGHAKTNLDRMLALLRKKEQRICMPSPLRMLRICNGRFCELCQQKRVYFVSPHFGIFSCKDCLERRGYVVSLRRWDPLYPRVSHLYTIPNGCHALKVFAKPFVDASGERCGPRLTLECQLQRQGRHEDDAFRRIDFHHRQTFLPVLEKSYQENLAPATARLVMDREDKYFASLAAQERRIQKIKALLAALETELGDVPWKEEILRLEWSDDSSRDCCDFLAPLAQDIVGPYVLAPSRLTTQASLRRLATRLRQAMAVFEQFGLHDFSFLYNGDPAQKALKEVCQQMFPSYSLLTKGGEWVNLVMLGRLRFYSPPYRAYTLSQFLHYRLGTMMIDDDEE